MQGAGILQPGGLKKRRGPFPGKGNPHVPPWLRFVRLVKRDFVGADEKALPARQAVRFPAAHENPSAAPHIMKQKVLPDGGAKRVARAAVLKPAEKRGKLAKSRVAGENGFFHACPPFFIGIGSIFPSFGPGIRFLFPPGSVMLTAARRKGWRSGKDDGADVGADTAHGVEFLEHVWQ